MLITRIKVRRPILLIASLVGFSLCASGFSYGQDNLAPEVTSPQQGSDGGEANGQGAFVPTVVGAPGDLIGAGTRGLAGTRVALVIGNSQYETVAALENPRNDAKAIAEALRQIGFDEVKLAEDLDYSEMRRTLKEFATNALGSEVALIYYAGHGVEVGGTNYVVPTDAELLRAQDVDFEGIPLDNIRSAVSGAAKLRLVILDACRNNPFKLASSDGKRSVGRGLARVESDANELIAYAAREGTLASDGTGRGNSPFATALIRHMQTPGLEINFLFRKVRDDVLSATSNEQEPYVYGSLGGEAIYLHLPKGGGSEVSAASPNPPSSDREALFWSSIEDSKNPADFKAYIERYPQGDFARLAEIRLAALGPDPAPATEEQTEEPTPEMLRSVQTELSRLGCYSGTIDGDWGRRSQAALDEFAWRTSQKAALNSQVMELLEAQDKRVCPEPKAKSKTANPEAKPKPKTASPLQATPKPKTASPSQAKPKATTASPSQTKPEPTTASRKPSDAGKKAFSAKCFANAGAGCR